IRRLEREEDAAGQAGVSDVGAGDLEDSAAVVRDVMKDLPALAANADGITGGPWMDVGHGARECTGRSTPEQAQFCRLRVSTLRKLPRGDASCVADSAIAG